MRVTEGMLSNLARERITRARSTVYEAQQVAGTGIRAGKPSDDPTAVAIGARASHQKSLAVSRMRTAEAGLGSLQFQDGTLADVGTLLSRAKELALQGSGGAASDSDRAVLVEELNAVREQVRSLANARFDGEYIFSGYATGTQPFAADGTYQGGTDTVELEVAAGVRVAKGVTGEAALTLGGGDNIFTALDALHTALSNNDPTAAQDTVGQMDDAIRQVAKSRATVGGHMQSFQTAFAAAERVYDYAFEQRSQLIEADPFEAYTDLSQALQALQAASQLAQLLPREGLLGG